MQRHRLLWLCFLILTLSGCELLSILEENSTISLEETHRKGQNDYSDYYGQFYEMMVTTMSHQESGTTPIEALDVLPKDPYGYVNWTAAVLKGIVSPKGTLEPDVEEGEPLDLNVFIEAKVALMNNVIFPHSIHTYWHSCRNCHPGIFRPEAGANPITMDEIFQGKWCGRCHGKVAFPLGVAEDPRANCNRCHVLPKGKSLERESF
jgi:c(7)-type cytochrome triheme protein